MVTRDGAGRGGRGRGRRGRGQGWRLWLGLVFVALMSGGVGCRPVLTGGAQPGADWPDLSDPPVGIFDGIEDGALLIAMEDPKLGGRPGAWAVSSGWARYLLDTRGVRPRQLTLLRDEQATVARVRRELDALERRAGTGGVLWVIMIGASESPASGEPGQLRLADGVLDQSELLGRVAYGYHESTFVLVDACAAGSSSTPGLAAVLPEGQVSGLPALHPPAVAGQVSPRLPRGGSVDSVPVQVQPMAEAVSAVEARVDADVMAIRSIRRNAFLITAGVGEGCRDHLDGRPWPALAWAALGALQGWADGDGNGWVSALELAIYSQGLLHRDAAGVRLEAAGADLGLAKLIDIGPPKPREGRARRRAERAQGRPGQRRGPAVPPGIAAVGMAEASEAREGLIMSLENSVAIPDGSFTMGCDPEKGGDPESGVDQACEDDEGPAHTVFLDGYTFDRHEVTWGDYTRCVRAGACPKVALYDCEVWRGDRFVRGGEVSPDMLADDHPVFCVDWFEAWSYCEAVGKRLPSEAEWERAARGHELRTYPWGEARPTCARGTISGCSEHYTRAVGSAPDGEGFYGAQDMSGNVSEWAYDWWDADSYSRMDAGDNPTGPERGEVRVVRGGSFYNTQTDLRASYRYGLTPSARMSVLGFRCAR